MWFTEPSFSGTNHIGRATTDGTITDNFSTGITTGSFTKDITVGPDGNLWFDEYNCAGNLGKITTGRTVAEYHAYGETEIYGLAVGSDGLFWFTGFQGVWKMTTAGSSTLVGGRSLPKTSNQTYGAQNVQYITTGPDGAICFTYATAASDGTYYIGRIDPASSALTGIAIGTNGSANGIASGPDGAIWFTGSNAGSPAIGRIALQSSSSARGQTPPRHSKRTRAAGRTNPGGAR